MISSLIKKSKYSRPLQLYLSFICIFVNYPLIRDFISKQMEIIIKYFAENNADFCQNVRNKEPRLRLRSEVADRATETVS